ncbi:PucR family transcriptional regulator [Tsukamurella soli]|uniref:Helix-turn-helix domain-containing protein n=1 Tax=Tsukamurella soli TaxID=644556 RepID=A0ABP8JW91_9ACTN
MATADLEATRRLVDLVAADVGALGAEMTERIIEEIPQLRGDETIERALAASVAANVETVVHALRVGADAARIVLPEPALDYPRRLAQRGMSMNALVRAYRIGHATMLAGIGRLVDTAALPAEGRLTAYESVTRWSFDYNDAATEQAIDAYERERERWLANRDSDRVLRVRELLADGDVDAAAATTVIRYPFLRTHIAVVVWLDADEDGDSVRRMERFVTELAGVVGAREMPLFVAADRMTGWGWVPLMDADGAVDALRRFVAGSAGHPRCVVGPPAPGVDGFRHSHRVALDVRRIADAGGARLLVASDPTVTLAALAGSDPAALRSWVGSVLGDLASDTAGDARLRETLRVVLDENFGYKAAAERLNLHANSVKYRVQRARERCGRSDWSDRVDVEVALAVCRWYGAAVLH